MFLIIKQITVLTLIFGFCINEPLNAQQRSAFPSRSQAPQASGGKKKELVLPPANAGDEILKNFEKAKTLGQFLNMSRDKLLPGDDVFLYKKVNNAHALLQSPKMPSLKYEVGVFVLRYGKVNISIRLIDREKFEFEINQQRIFFKPAMLSNFRWLQVNDMLVSQKVAAISFIPVAFAQNQGEPTLSNVIVFSIMSRLAMDATSGLDVKTQEKNVTIVDLMKKIKLQKAGCSFNYLAEVLKNLAAFQTNSIRCEEGKAPRGGQVKPINGNVAFDIPFGDNVYRQIRIVRSQNTVEEISPDMDGKVIKYKRSSEGKEVNFVTLYSKQKQSFRTLRQKGLEWRPVGIKQEEFVERAEQFREAVNFLARTDFCNRCGLTIRKYIPDILQDKEMAPEVK